ncbi:F-box and associated interaction domains-containing protein [Hibiscus syriacus]|uniref:F-box and associated interaction domains-containing protein n=1 Tax=Hibiscus syriacus TaxID=106335 RepID=A0A6A3D1Y7_HIBSY|nr:F-box and associated interaction domains-containing protein [Hibiscus syriacus]
MPPPPKIPPLHFNLVYTTPPSSKEAPVIPRRCQLPWRRVLSGEFINSLDFDAEQFGAVLPPDTFQEFQELDENFVQFTKTGVQGRCLFLIYDRGFMECEIWVMKEYGVKEYWTKQFVINAYNSPHVLSWNSYQPLVVLSNGEVLMLIDYDTISCYNHKRKYFRGTKFLKISSPFVALDAIAYTPCFVFLYDVAKGEQISRYYNIILKLAYALSI